METGHPRLTATLRQDYGLFPLAVPHYKYCHIQMARALAQLSCEAAPSRELPIVEIGTGLGVGTRLLLENLPGRRFILVDSDASMLAGAQDALESFGHRLEFLQADALDFFRGLRAASIAAVVSAWTIHNWQRSYRAAVTAHIAEAVTRGGRLINCDKYFYDDRDDETERIREQFRGFFETYLPLGRVDIIRDWIDHYLEDSLSRHRMDLVEEIEAWEDLGFSVVDPPERLGLETILIGGRV